MFTASRRRKEKFAMEKTKEMKMIEIEKPKIDEEELAHRWQSFRITCLKLALKSGATEQNAIEVADKFGKYILTKSEIEKNVADRENKEN
jgi:hypothetical protein